MSKIFLSFFKSRAHESFSFLISGGARAPRAEEGFTRVELAAVLAALALMAMVAFPLLANTKPRGDRLTCVNNLRQIGQAFHTWANDHGDQKPWQVPVQGGGIFRPDSTITLPGFGQYPPQAVNNIYFQFAWIYRELGTPKILVCPSDPRSRAATSFSMSPDGGFMNGGYMNNAVSYAISADPPFADPRGSLCADRNLLNSGYGACSYILGQLAQINFQRIGWTNAIHGESGNMLFNSGAVQQLSSGGLRTALDYRRDDGSSLHFLARP